MSRMTRARRTTIAVAIGAVSLLGIGAYATTAGAGSPARPPAPPRPSWVDANGNVDLDKEPAMPIWAPDGDGVQHNPDGSVKLAKRGGPTGGPFGR